MKVALVFLGALCAVALCVPVEHGKVADKVLLEKQKKIMGLFYRVLQPSTLPEHVEIAKSFAFEDHINDIKPHEVARNFSINYANWKLPRGDIFSVFHMDHLRQAVYLFNVFYYAKDWDTFYKVAVWARQNINEGMFVYALSLAVVHRPDNNGVMMPPIYEILPHYFFTSDVIHQAYVYKQTHKYLKSDHGHDNHKGSDVSSGHFNGYTINSNYSGAFKNLHPEQSMSSFLEDVDMNAVNYYFHIHYPFWMDSNDYGWETTRRGELFVIFIQQMYAKYNLERTSHGFGEVPHVDFEGVVETSFDPSLIYPNGFAFPTRPKFANLDFNMYNYKQRIGNNFYAYSGYHVNDFDRRIDDAIDSGVVFNDEGEKIHIRNNNGINVIGNIIQGNKDSPSRIYYGSIMYYAQHLLGYAPQGLDSYKVLPSALEHYETAQRDPVYWQLLKRIILKLVKFKYLLPAYTEEELVLPGVKVTNLEIDPLVTYDDYFFADLSNAVFYKDNEEPGEINIRVRQTRLNHKPFGYKVHVHADKPQKVSVKLFMAPHEDQYGRVFNLSENVEQVVEMEHFVHDLQAGENVISRNSEQMVYFSHDRVSSGDLYKQTLAALEGNSEMKINHRQNHFFHPHRSLLPKGTIDGVSYRFYVIVYKYEPYHEQSYAGDFYAPGSNALYVDNKPFLFPFNRPIYNHYTFTHIPNSYIHVADVVHKDVHEINSPEHQH